VDKLKLAGRNLGWLFNSGMLVYTMQSKGSNRKQSARWQHLSRLKAGAFCIWKNKLWWPKTQQIILGTGTVIWWVTEPHRFLNKTGQLKVENKV
jgi:hypothetical protein